MNTVSVILCVIIGAVFIFGIYKTIKSKGKCSCCDGSCQGCSHSCTGCVGKSDLKQTKRKDT